MTKLRLGLARAATIVTTILIWTWLATKLLVTLIGATTVTDDYNQFVDRLPAILQWLFSTPWWVPALLATALTIFLIWLAWPTQPPPQPIQPVPAKPQPDAAKLGNPWPPVTRKLTAGEVDRTAKCLHAVNDFLATDVENLILGGRQIANWRDDIRSRGHLEGPKHIQTRLEILRAEKNRVANELNALLKRYELDLDGIALDLREISAKIESWQGPIQEAVRVVQLLPHLPANQHDGVMNPGVNPFGRVVGETKQLVQRRQADIKNKLREISPA
jgi:hypothetical protein